MMRTLLTVVVLLAAFGSSDAQASPPQCENCDPVARHVPVAQPAPAGSVTLSLREARAIARALGWQTIALFASDDPAVRVHCQPTGNGATCGVRAYGDRAAIAFRLRMAEGETGLSIRADRLRVL